MKLHYHTDHETQTTTYTLEITKSDMEKVQLQKFDYLLFKDCSGDDATIADKLLGLETLARRIEEGCEKNGT